MRNHIVVSNTILYTKFEDLLKRYGTLEKFHNSKIFHEVFFSRSLFSKFTWQAEINTQILPSLTGQMEIARIFNKNSSNRNTHIARAFIILSWFWTTIYKSTRSNSNVQLNADNSKFSNSCNDNITTNLYRVYNFEMDFSRLPTTHRKITQTINTSSICYIDSITNSSFTSQLIKNFRATRIIEAAEEKLKKNHTPFRNDSFSRDNEYMSSWVDADDEKR